MSLFGYTVGEGLGSHIIVPCKVEILSVDAKQESTLREH